MDSANHKRANPGYQRDSLCQTEPNPIKYPLTKRSEKDEKLENKLKPQNLLYRQYLHAETDPRVFQYGTATFQNSKGEDHQFRMFTDRDLRIPSRFQNKLNEQIMDEDCQTQYSQVKFAVQQNRIDLMRAIYWREREQKTNKTASQIERSLFGDVQGAQSQPVTHYHSNVIYYTQPCPEQYD